MKTFQSWFFKILWWLTFMAIIVMIAAYANREWIAKQLVEKQIHNVTGLEPEMTSFSFGVLDPKVTFTNLKLFNPAQYGGTLFLDVPDLHIEYDRNALRHHEIHIKLMRADIREMDVVKNSAGATNIMAFLKTMAPRTAGGLRTFAPVNGYKFTGIDMLNLSLGKVKFVDLTDQRLDRSVAIGLQDQIYTNVVTTADLRGLSARLWYRGAYMVGLPVHPPKGGTTAQALLGTP